MTKKLFYIFFFLASLLAPFCYVDAAFDTSTSAANSNNTTVSLTLTAAAANETAIIVVGVFRDSVLSPTCDNISAVTVGGVAANFVAKVSSSNQCQSLYYFNNPPNAATSYSVTLTDSDGFTDEAIAVSTYSDTLQTSGVIDSSNTLDATGNHTISTTVVCSGAWLVSSAGSASAGSGTTVRTSSAELSLGDSNGTVGTGVQSMGWISSVNSDSVIVSLAPATGCGGGGGGGGTATTTAPFSVASVWALSALALIMIVVSVYFLIFFMIFAFIGWGLAQFFRAILEFLHY